MKTFFTCSLINGSRDCDNIIAAYNQGIDSRLEGFTESWHKWTNGRLYLYIANIHEFQILIRRLLELENEFAEILADNMIYWTFGYEVV